MSDDGERMIVFRLGGERFALPLGAVDEVIELPAVQRVPDAPPTVLGIATLRGELVSVYDPREWLQAGTGPYGAVLLFSRGKRRIGIAVDDVFDPTTVFSEERRNAPGVDTSDGILAGVVRRGTDLIGVLDADALVHAALAIEGEMA
jgi:purine-binding chemotaxis protein CheW